MHVIVLFILIVLFGLIPFGYIVVWSLYKRTIIFQTAMSVFIGSMGVGIVGFIVGNLGLHHIWWAIPVCLVWLLSINFYAKKMIRKPIQELNKKIEMLSMGELNLKIEPETKAIKSEVGHIACSIEVLINKLNEVTNEIDATARRVAEMSKDLTEVATVMNQTNTSQASSIEEISASMEEMVGNIENNTSNSKETEKIAVSAANDIKYSNTSMQAAVTAMKQISEKINTISNIAFQTNILALNAAVESARAGEHGKGFGVVAGEVRKLAENSKKVSDEIISLAHKGMQITSEAGNNLEKVIPSITTTAKLVQEISSASIEQNSGSHQINNSIQLLNQVVQNNAKTSEDLNNSARDMYHQSELLLQTISFFKK